MNRDLFSSDSSTSASISSTAQFSIISSSYVLTKFNFSFGEAVINSKRCLLIGSTWRRSFASFDNLVITLRLLPRFARVRVVFRPFYLESQGISAPRWLSFRESYRKPKPTTTDRRLFYKKWNHTTLETLHQYWYTRWGSHVIYFVANSYTNFC